MENKKTETEKPQELPSGWLPPLTDAEAAQLNGPKPEGLTEKEWEDFKNGRVL